MNKTFVIYSKQGCPFCTKIEKVMKLSEQQHVIYMLGDDFTKEEFYNEFGFGSTFPQVIMGEEKLGGCTDTVAYLKENGMIWWKNSIR